MNTFSLNPLLRDFTVMTTAVGNERESVVTLNPLTAPRAQTFSQNGLIKLPLTPGYPDAVPIIAWLQGLSVQFGREPLVRQVTELALGSAVSNNSILRQIDRVASFVRQNVRFVQDPEGTEYVKTPLRMMREIEAQGYTIGDCDEHVLLLNSMLRSLGLETKVAGAKIHGTPRWDHVFSMVWDGRQWADVDACVKAGPQPSYRERLIA